MTTIDTHKSGLSNQIIAAVKAPRRIVTVIGSAFILLVALAGTAQAAEPTATSQTPPAGNVTQEASKQQPSVIMKDMQEHKSLGDAQIMQGVGAGTAKEIFPGLKKRKLTGKAARRQAAHQKQHKASAAAWQYWFGEYVGTYGAYGEWGLWYEFYWEPEYGMILLLPYWEYLPTGAFYLNSYYYYYYYYAGLGWYAGEWS